MESDNAFGHTEIFVIVGESPEIQTSELKLVCIHHLL